jgi:hypothetical protein
MGTLFLVVNDVGQKGDQKNWYRKKPTETVPIPNQKENNDEREIAINQFVFWEKGQKYNCGKNLQRTSNSKPVSAGEQKQQRYDVHYFDGFYCIFHGSKFLNFQKKMKHLSKKRIIISSILQRALQANCLCIQ